jgi:hypothetical protein
VNFGLTGNASGTFEIVLTGDLVPYTDGLDNPKQTSVPVPPHKAYTRLALNFSITASVSGSVSYSGGAYGVKGSASSADTYTITFCKAFDPSTSVESAIGLTFQSFVLPLNSATMTLLDSGDYLLNEFDGNLNLSFGAFAGIDQVLYSGQSSADVLSVNKSPLATLSAQIKPEIKADVELDFTFQYATKFEALVSKIGTTGKLHLFRSSKADATTSLMAGLTFDGNTSAKIQSNAQTVANSLANSAGVGSEAVTQVTSGAVAEINKGVTDANSTVSSWLNRANGLKANLQVAIEQISTRNLLAAYDFDLGDDPKAPSPGLQDAWNLAVKGDLAGALNYKDPGGKCYVTLETGSGLENEYQQKTSFSCNFFNLWKFSSWNQWQSQVSMVYAGNNVFHMSANIGRTTERDSVGAMKNINFYFSASADEAVGGIISKPVVDLHIDLTAQGASNARQVAGILSGISSCAACSAMARNMNEFIDAYANGTVQLNIKIPSSAYGYIAADPASNSQTPANSVHDQKNWDTFITASNNLSVSPLRQLVPANYLSFVESYAGWKDFNKTFIGAEVPNRNAFGDAQNWPQDLLQMTDDSLTRLGIANVIICGQYFMNLCDSIQQLAGLVDLAGTTTTWNQLVDAITKAAKDYMSDYARPVAMALIWLCGSGVISISGPSDADASSGKFQVKLSL